MGKILYKIFFAIGEYFNKLGLEIKELASIFKNTEVKENQEEENLIEAGAMAHHNEHMEYESASHFPLLNMSFEDGLLNPSYEIRHQMAAKLIVYYTLQQGEVSELLMYVCAEVILENFEHTRADEEELVVCWKDLRNCTDGNYEEIELREEALYERLKEKTLKGDLQ